MRNSNHMEACANPARPGKPVKIISLLISSLFILSAAFASEDTDKIRKAFDTYQKATLANDGALAYSVVDENTRGYYDYLLESALHLSKEELLSKDFIDKFQIITLRHRVPKEVLLSMDGKKLFIHAIEQGWTGKDSISNMYAGDISIINNNALAQILANMKPTPLFFRFSKEGDSWKFDLTNTMMVSNFALMQAQQRVGMSEEEFIIAIIEESFGGKVDPNTIYEPVIPVKNGK